MARLGFPVVPSFFSGAKWRFQGGRAIAGGAGSKITKANEA
jgi:hypothetical protein